MIVCMTHHLCERRPCLARCCGERRRSHLNEHTYVHLYEEHCETQTAYNVGTHADGHGTHHRVSHRESQTYRHAKRNHNSRRCTTSLKVLLPSIHTALGPLCTLDTGSILEGRDCVTHRSGITVTRQTDLRPGVRRPGAQSRAVPSRDTCECKCVGEQARSVYKRPTGAAVWVAAPPLDGRAVGRGGSGGWRGSLWYPP